MDKHSISIDANNMEEALRIGSRALQIDRNRVVVTSSQQLPDGGYRFQISPRSDDDPLNFEFLLQSVESQIEDLDTKSMIRGLASSDLKEKGLLDPEHAGIKRSLHSRPRQVGNILFKDDIDYLECDQLKLDDPQWIEGIQRVAIVDANVQFASIKTMSVREVQKDLLHQKDQGISVVSGSEETYLNSRYPGRLIIVEGKLYLLPRDIPARIVLHPIQNPMIVTADLTPPQGDGTPLDTTQVERLLAEAKIIFGIQTNALENMIRKSTEEHAYLQDICLARGMPPMNGSDAKIDLFFNNTPNSEFQVLPDGKIDYRKRTLIPMAHPGDLLARVSLPSTGQPGMDVFGIMIEAQTGNPLPLYAGEGVRASEDGREFWATREGQITLGADVIAVLPMYQVNGDVDYHTGNIEFDGNVTITGSILPGFTVKAKGDLTVQGNIETAFIEVGRDLVVMGGIIGSATSPIKVGRHLVVHHLQNADLEVEGNVQVLHSALHCQIETSGEFQCVLQKGALIGGTLIALKNSEVRIVGSSAGTITRVILGQDFLVRKKIKEARDALAFVSAGIKKIEDYLAPLLNRLGKENLLHTPEQVQRLKLIIERRKEMTQQQSLLKTRVRRLENSAILQSGVKFKVHGALYMDTKLQLSHLHWNPDHDFQNVELMVDSTTGKMKINSLRG